MILILSIFFCLNIFYNLNISSINQAVYTDAALNKDTIKLNDDFKMEKTFQEHFNSLILSVICGIVVGKLSEMLGHPKMLGMLVTGIILNYVLPEIFIPIPHSWTAKFWPVVLTSVVCRAGLALQMETFRNNLIVTLCLGAIPVLIESLFLVGLTKYIFNLPTSYAITLGFGVGCVSPGVVVPMLMGIIEKMQGKGQIPRLMLAALGTDNFIGTMGFGIGITSITNELLNNKNMLNFNARSDSQIEMSRPIQNDFNWFMKRLLFESTSSVFIGFILGMIGMLLKSKLLKSYFKIYFLHAIFFGVTTLLMVTLKLNGYIGMAISSVLISWCVVGNYWEKSEIENAHYNLKNVWKFSEPFLFTIIGLNISFNTIPFELLYRGIGIIVLGAIVRLIITILLCRVSNLSATESVFVGGTWCGKASIQATICTATVDLVHSQLIVLKEDEENAQI
ncbi:Sodium/hydrogen exchanger 9B2, partial [Lobulomyces angularis]